MKRVLLTGGSGFVGRHTVAALVERGYEVHALSSRVVTTDTDGVRWHRTDLLDLAATAQLVAELRPSHLLHLAWYVEHGKFWRSPLNFRWLEASLALLRHFREHGGERAVMAGTCAEYDWAYGFCSEGVTPCQPGTSYGVCKNALQETLRSFSVEGGLSSAWGRIFFLYGPNEHPARLLASVIDALLRGETARCTHGAQVRDFLHVEDAAAAFVALLDSQVEGAVNVASGVPITLREAVAAAATCIGGEGRVDFGAIAAAPDDPPLLVADVRRLTKEVGWRPRYDLASGVARTVYAHREKMSRG